MTIDKIYSYQFKCDVSGCFHSSAHSNVEDARYAETLHNANHVLWADRGSKIKSQVFDTSHSDEYFGHISKAEQHARALFCAYFAWNGWVHKVGAIDMSNPVCRCEDVDIKW